MNGPIGRRRGLLWVAAGFAALLAFSMPGLSQVASETVRNMAVLTYEHADHDQGDGDRGAGARSHDKSEPTRGGLRRAGLLDTDLRHPESAINGLTSTVNQLALSANRQIVQSDPQNVDPGQSSDTEVACPYPFKVVNGGESNTGNMVRLTKNYPAITSTSSAWHVQVHNDDSTPRSYRVYADCINGLTQYSRLEHLNQEVAPGASGEYYVKCSADTTILGGGFSVEATDRFAVNSSYAGSGLPMTGGLAGVTSARHPPASRSTRCARREYHWAPRERAATTTTPSTTTPTSPATLLPIRRSAPVLPKPRVNPMHTSSSLTHTRPPMATSSGHTNITTRPSRPWAPAAQFRKRHNGSKRT